MLFMRRFLKYTLLFTIAISSVAYAQQSSSVNIWNGGSVTGIYNLYSVDSLTFKNGGEDRVKVWSVGGGVVGYDYSSVDSITLYLPEIESTNRLSDEVMMQQYDDIKILNGYKNRVNLHHNPLMPHKFGADPFAMVYDGRLYVYMSDDHKTYNADGTLKEGDYSDIKNISIISTDDMVNWTDHGAVPVAGKNGGTGPATWANNSWAPCAAYKEIDGKMRFFLYFADNASGIGVVTSSTPYGPWSDPLKGPLISRSTPNCSDVTWLFDPAVLMDDDGSAYLYFGGGVPEGKAANPGTARAVKLGDDMISIEGTPVRINPPYLFEDAGINKIGNKYLYSYCSNWTSNSDPGVAKIAYMESDSPLGPFKYVGAFFDNPGGASWAGGGGNNHHAVCYYQGKYYIFYHTRALKAAMGITGGAELRSACVSELGVDTIKSRFRYLKASEITAKGVKQIKNLNPYQRVEGETMAWSSNIYTDLNINKYTRKCTVKAVSSAPGAWIGLSGVDFQNGGAKGIKARVSGKGVIKVCLSYPTATNALCCIELPGGSTAKDVVVPLLSDVVGVKRLFFVFSEADASLDYWEIF